VLLDDQRFVLGRNSCEYFNIVVEKIWLAFYEIVIDRIDEIILILESKIADSVNIFLELSLLIFR
jgi:hypothetical protein